MSSLSFAKSSKKAWTLLNRLSGKYRKTNKVYPITSDQIAAQLVKSSHGLVSKEQRSKRYSTNFRTSPKSSTYSTNYTPDEVTEAISEIECGKAPGLDNVFLNCLVNLGPKAITCLAKFFTSIHRSGQLPKVWKKAKVIAVLIKAR